ncbi:hypothetical protein HPB50_001148 [Hyalomma asiaticum]|uniref:Uncharacterized protein n=1 Tax=Hyalomma asiaticum TaxID=266040 RepID=A0ACB7TCF6_HYAAI|nr:hypothetical protein HPB50_001148 [Hyalomma asiaticum]
MERNDVVSKRPADDNATSVEWLDRFHREKRPRRSMRHCYAAVAAGGAKKHFAVEAAGSAATSCAIMPDGLEARRGDLVEEQVQQGKPKIRADGRSGRPDMLLSGIFSPPPEIVSRPGRGIDEPELLVTCPESRSAPFTLVLSSVYALSLHVCFAASSWWLVQRYAVSGARTEAIVTLFLAQLSSLPLFVVGVCRLVGRQEQPSSGCVLLLVLHVLAAGLFNMVPLLQLLLRLVDSVVLYKTRGKQDQAARLKRQDVITFTNVMWVVTLSCFPQAVFQATKLFQTALNEEAYTTGSSSWLQAVNLTSAVLLTCFACLKFNNRHSQIIFTWPTFQSLLRTGAENIAWLPIISARVLAFAILLAKALEPTHVFGIFFALSLHFEFRRDRTSPSSQQRSFPITVAANVARATVGMFFKLRNWQEPLAAKPYIVFVIMLFVQSFGCIFLPFLQQYGLSMNMDAFRAYYGPPVFVACIVVHYALLVIGAAGMVAWYRMERASSSGYGEL